MALEIGSLAPDFALPDQGSNYTKLNRLVEGARGVVVYFFPQAGAPGCTREACGFRDAMAEFEARGVRVVGICTDPTPALAAFAASNALNFPILSDADHAVAEEWGAWRGMSAGRVTFLLDEKGVVAHHFPRVDVNRHAADVLALYGAAPAEETSAAAAAASSAPVDQDALAVELARGALHLLLARLEGGAALPGDVAELASRVAARGR